MAEKRTRRRFTAEYKAQAVQRLMEGGSMRGKSPGGCRPSGLCWSVMNPTCSRHVGVGEDHPFGPAAGQA